jgi:hypothetical protein
MQVSRSQRTGERFWRLGRAMRVLIGLIDVSKASISAGSGAPQNARLRVSYANSLGVPKAHGQNAAENTIAAVL